MDTMDLIAGGIDSECRPVHNVHFVHLVHQQKKSRQPPIGAAATTEGSTEWHSVLR